MTNAIEPLTPSLWFERIVKVANGQLGSVENALRHAAHLLQLTPAPLSHVFTLESDEEGFEALLNAGSLDAAARCLVRVPTALTVEAVGEDGSYRATIDCPVRGRAVSGRGENEASAILDAWTTCLLNLRREYGSDWLIFPCQSGHRSRGG